MIYNGRTGWVRGDLNQPVDTILAMTKGPIKGKNWFNTNFDPTYSITITSGASGAVVLEGTNDITFASNDDSPNTVSADLLPAQDATWDTIAGPTSSDTDGTITTSYWYLRLRITTQGDGVVTNAWVYWN
jgi:hypothetical protein